MPIAPPGPTGIAPRPRDVDAPTTVAKPTVSGGAPGGTAASEHGSVTASGTGHANRAVELARAVLERFGLPATDEAAKRVLDERPGLRNAVKLFQWLKGDEAAGRAHNHSIVNGEDAIGTSPATSTVLQEATARLQSYVREYGYADVMVKGEKLVLVGVDGKTVEAGKIDTKAGANDGVDAWVRKLGRLVNEQRVGHSIAVPPTLPAEVHAKDFSPANALVASHLSMLAYQSEAAVKTQLAVWGFDLSTFAFVESAQTDTQGFVCADAQGQIHVVFRGTSSGTDALTDATASLRAPPWASDVKVHKGFSDSLESVWLKTRAAIEAARAKLGQESGVMFSGHSLGGALTQLCAAKCAKLGIIGTDRAQVYTKGGPRVGDDAFKRLCQSTTPRTFRLVHSKPGIGFDNDPVTAVPPKVLGFRHAGHMVKIGDDSTEIIRAGAASMGGALGGLESRLRSVLNVGGAMFGAAPPPLEDASDPEDSAVEALRAGRLQGHLESLTSVIGTVRAAAHGDEAAVAAVTERALALGANHGAELRGFGASQMLGVGLHFMAGYLRCVSQEVLRKL